MIGPILLDVVGPILLLIGVGALLRWKFELDMATLSKLNIYFAVPAFIFQKVSTSTLPFTAMGGVVVVTVVHMASLGVLVWGIGKAFNVSRQTLAAVALAVIFYNSGNYGLPLAELAYPSDTADGRDGAAVQAFVVMTLNFLTFTAGLGIASAAQHGFKWSSLARVFRLPMIPALLAGVLCKWWLGGDEGRELPALIAKPTEYIAGALVPLSLATLGAQLASQPRWPRWRPVSVVLLLRLVIAPIQLAVILWTFHYFNVKPMDLWGPNGWPAELLILTAAVPTAINTLLLTMELDGDVALAADCVFWTTISSCITIPIWLWVVWWAFGTVPT